MNAALLAAQVECETNIAALGHVDGHGLLGIVIVD
jgi:hypothetical protein